MELILELEFEIVGQFTIKFPNSKLSMVNHPDVKSVASFLHTFAVFENKGAPCKNWLPGAYILVHISDYL